MTLDSRLARVERTLCGREPKTAGPLILVVALDADGRGRFSVEGAAYEVGSLAELDACFEAHGWQPQRVIFRLPELGDSPGAEARFAVIARDGS